MRRARMGTLPSTYVSTTLLEGLKREYQQLTPELRGAIREVLLEFSAGRGSHFTDSKQTTQRGDPYR